VGSVTTANINYRTVSVLAGSSLVNVAEWALACAALLLYVTTYQYTGGMERCNIARVTAQRISNYEKGIYSV
jgi:hypothetical protein